MIVFLLLTIIFFLTGCVTAVLTLVKKLRKKAVRLTGILCGAFFGSALICAVLSIAVDMSFPENLGLIGMAVLASVPVLLIIALIFRIMKKRSARTLLFVALGVFVLGIFGMCVGFGIITVSDRKKHLAAGEIESITATVTELDFEVKDGEEPLEIPTDSGFDNSSGYVSQYELVYDESKDGLVLSLTDVTPEMCIASIRNSTTIDEDRKEMFCDFVLRIADRYPDADLSILYHNLADLQVQDVDSLTMMHKTLSATAYACYVMPENAIYLPKDADYVEGTWDYQALIHEFCHVCRTSWFEDGDRECRMKFDSAYENELLMEAMNSVFSCSLLNYYEPDIGYQMPSNYLRIMVECMDNYELSDYINHSDCYFLSKLDEQAGYTNYAQVIWKLITLQRTDWEKDSIDIPAEEYEPIYDFLCELYYGKYLTEDMSRDEALALADELAEKVGYDCPEGYKFEEEYFTEYMEELLAARE